MKTPIPERINVEKGDRVRYNKLRQKLGKRFYLTDVFTLAMAYGYVEGIRRPLVAKEGLFRTVSARDNFHSLMILLYINEKDNVPNDYEELSEAFIIAQEYANAGLKLLEKDIYSEMDNFTNKLASIMLKFDDKHNFSDKFEELGIE